jgi:hypothetical protein
MKFRIVKKTYYLYSGKARIDYYPQEKGLFFWHNFEEWHGTCPLTVSFDTLEKAESYILAHIKNHTKDENTEVVVKEFEVDNKLWKA